MSEYDQDSEYWSISSFEEEDEEEEEDFSLTSSEEQEELMMQVAEGQQRLVRYVLLLKPKLLTMYDAAAVQLVETAECIDAIING